MPELGRLGTEAQARASECCGFEGCGARRDDGRRVCVGSACMAWRWNPAEYETLYLRSGDEPPEGEGWSLTGFTKERLAIWGRGIETEATGFCGLAGPPNAPGDSAEFASAFSSPA